MQTIGLISDTHGYLDPEVFRYFEDCDQIWHLGDIGDEKILSDLKNAKPTKAVFGNIDTQQLRFEIPEIEIIELEGLRFMLIHIAGKPPRYTKQIRDLLKNDHVDVIICGHSHIETVQKDRTHNIIFLNPGAAGKQGFHKYRHLMKFKVENKKITNLELIKLGKR